MEFQIYIDKNVIDYSIIFSLNLRVGKAVFTAPQLTLAKVLKTYNDEPHGSIN